MDKDRSAWLDEAFDALGAVLESRGQQYDLVLVGGASLLLRGTIARPTRDADILGTRSADGDVVPLAGLPTPLAEAVADVALAYGLARDWLNLGPASLLELGLPEGFGSRLEARQFGGLVIWIAGLFDLVCLKLYAATDHWPARDRHLADLRALAPSADDLRAAARWAKTHDPSPAFAANLAAVLRSIGYEGPDDDR
jgi:hypothetical protein